MPYDDSEKPTGSKAEKRRLDRISRLVIMQGAPVSVLGMLFGLDQRTVQKRLAACDVAGMRQGTPVYRIRDAAPYLVKPVGDLEEYLKNATIKELPVALTKEYWAAQSLRQKFLEEKGDLWRSDYVVGRLSAAFQKCRTALLLMSDAVERETQLSERQRELLKNLIDSTMEEMRVGLVEDFAGDETDDEYEPDAPGVEPDGASEDDFWATGATDDEDEYGGL